MTLPPRWLSGLARRVLRLRFPEAIAVELEGDLVELWMLRMDCGRPGLRRSLIRDLIGLVARPGQAGARSSGPECRRYRPAIASGWLQDARQAVRVASRQPLFTLLAVGTLALGISATAGIFTATNRLLLRPLPFPNPASLVVVENAPLSRSDTAGFRLSPGVDELGIFAGAGLYAQGGVNLGSDDAPLRVLATVASPGFFDAMGVRPRTGRTYTREDDAEGSNRVAVISSGLWRQLGNDPTLVGRELLVNLRGFRVVGVMPPDFDYPGGADLWILPGADSQVTGGAFAPEVIARLAPGVGFEQATVALDRLITERYQARGAELRDEDLVRLHPLQTYLTRETRPLLLLLSAAVALLLLVSCSNVASLLLSRVTRRQPELALRRALGGTRWQLGRLLLVESLLLSLTAGVIGTFGAAGLLQVIPMLSEQPFPGVDLAAVDVGLLLTALAASLGTGLLFGIAPGLAAALQPGGATVRIGTTVAGSRLRSWFQSSLVVLQVSVALVLLSVTASTVATIVRLAAVDLGFDNPSALAVEVTLPLERYGEPDAVIGFYRDAAARLIAVPGVDRIAAAGVVPGFDSVGIGLRLVPAGTPAEEADRFGYALRLVASPGYFETMGIRVIRGRGFLPTDTRSSPRVVIVSESEALALWPDGRNPVGEHVTISSPVAAQLYEVVGVAADVALQGPRTERRAQFYEPILQSPPYGPMTFVVESALPPPRLMPALAAALAEVDPALPMYNVQRIEDIASGFLAAHRLAMTLMAAFAVVTLLLAAIGLYGVLAQLVSQRTREIGIRMALGASERRLLAGVVGQGLRIALIGVVIGAGAAGLATTLLASFVPDLDAPTWQLITMTAGALLLVTTIAAWLPARRAAAFDPLSALRSAD